MTMTQMMQHLINLGIEPGIDGQRIARPSKLVYRPTVSTYNSALPLNQDVRVHAELGGNSKGNKRNSAK
jgi:hypothetical protein